MSFIKAFILQPLFKARLNHVRLKQDIGTTLGEVRQQAPDFDASNVSRKQMTNRSLDQMWQNEINPNTLNQNSIDHWNRRGNRLPKTSSIGWYRMISS
ncbi:hypothetical protein [Paenibacillus sp. UNC499MF]|uniref:hypothetical protein n=1 Tax=Paenibacillus sp. UNC499MF TaxID=1502751 RepID=UPI0011B0CC29|nr:hypothetical protein [Paenibacillus sp. UNC499MF]